MQSEPQFSPINENDSLTKDCSGMDLESPVACYNLRDQNIDYLPPTRPLFQYSGTREKIERQATSPADSQSTTASHHHHQRLLDSQTSSSASMDSSNLSDFQQLTTAMQQRQQQTNFEQSFLNQSLPDDDKTRTNKQKPTKRRSIDDKPIMV